MGYQRNGCDLMPTHINTIEVSDEYMAATLYLNFSYRV